MLEFVYEGKGTCCDTINMWGVLSTFSDALASF